MLSDTLLLLRGTLHWLLYIRLIMYTVCSIWINPTFQPSCQACTGLMLPSPTKPMGLLLLWLRMQLLMKSPLLLLLLLQLFLLHLLLLWLLLVVQQILMQLLMQVVLAVLVRWCCT